ncbi:hypothetical protein [Gemmatimonas sp.]
MSRQDANILRVQLTHEERTIMLQRLTVPPAVRDQLLSNNSQSREVWLSADDAEAVREAAQDLLDREGFDEDYRPTAIGRLMETLIDKFYPG